MLGESGVHALTECIVKHVEALIEGPLSSYVRAVQEALPASSKLPSHQYGAAGCYSYFEAKLADLRSYEELHSGAFHAFRQWGNALSLLRMLEAGVAATATERALQLPPRGVPSTLVGAATAVAAAWGQQPDESDMVLMAQQLAELSAPLAPHASLLSAALRRVAQALLPLAEAWLADEVHGADLLDAYDTSRAFNRVWAALQVLYCTVPSDNMPDGAPLVDNAHLFGDGFTLAGAVALHMLGQRHRHDLFSFNAHVLQVHLTDADKVASNVAIEDFLTRVAQLKRQHDSFALMLESSDAPDVYNAWRKP